MTFLSQLGLHQETFLLVLMDETELQSVWSW